MKVAVPTRGNEVDEHFGHCEEYTIFTLDETRNVSNEEKLPSPQGCGCKSDIAGILKQKGVQVMLAGNMGMGAYNVLNYHGIEVYRGCSGNIYSVVEKYAKGGIADSNESCKTHGNGEGGHVCNH
ncbi:MAG TPA: NifB/NifX family molybdenum-iron cluster-binding protein [Bacteroidales bacterium]|nr:NifB/NifX family molybdenum-iron cluster-binding protein [Bacteroidales bacterium]